MHGTLMLVGALTLATGLLTGLVVLMAPQPAPWWVPASWLLSGVLGGLLWFALAGIVRRLDEISTRLGASPSRTE